MKSEATIDVYDVTPAAGNIASPAIQALFWRPRLMARSPSLVHVPFLFWLSSILVPHKIAVLGVGEGLAHFAFCQALDKLSILGKCSGYGYWTDEGSGAAPKLPPAPLREHEAMLYEGVSELSAGEEPGEDLSQARLTDLDLIFVDLLNLPDGKLLDGQDCLARLKPAGVLILHGTNGLEQRESTGVDWVALIQSTPRVELRANAGVTVLFRSEELPDALRALISSCSDGLLPSSVEAVFRRVGQALEAIVDLQGAHAAQSRVQEMLIAAEAAQDASNKSLQELMAIHEQYKRKLAQMEGEVFALRAANARMEESIAQERTRLCSAGDAHRTARVEAEARAAAERTARFEETATLTRLLNEARADLAEMDRLRGHNHALEQKIAALHSSASWRITAPIRKIKRSLTSRR